MSQTVTWRCDRCAGVIAVGETFAHFDGSSSSLFVSQWHEAPAGWISVPEADRLLDVCPACVTDRERVDLFLNRIEVDSCVDGGDS